MSSQIIKILMKEHEQIVKLVEALHSESLRLKSGSEINQAFFANAIDFIKNYADKFHHAKEEDILFKELCKESVKEKMHCNPMEQMLYEHDIGRNFVKAMQKALEENNTDMLAENSENYVMLLKEHIFKEDNILYPMADDVLDKKSVQEMLKKFGKVEQENKNSVQKHLKFIKNLKVGN